MSEFDDFPTIQCKPGPSDAELEAERDIKHAVDVAMFDAEEQRGNDHIPPWQVHG